MANEGRFFARAYDREIQAAGKSEFLRMETAAKCLEKFEESTPPSIVARHQKKTQPAPGVQTWNFNHTVLPASTIFGGRSDPNTETVPSLLSPAGKTKFGAAVEQAQFPTGRAPLGKARNPKVPLHQPPVPGSTVFGITNSFESSTAECMDFPKLPEELERTAKAMYIQSHGAVGPGEQTQRKYTQAFDTNKKFGKPTPHSKEGKSLKSAMHWINDSRAAKVTPLISSAARDYADRYEAPLGAPYEPLRDTREGKTFEEAHMYGSTPLDTVENVQSLFDGGMGAPDDSAAMLTTLTGEQSFAATQPFVHIEKIEVTSVAVKALLEEFMDIDVKQNDRVTGLMHRHIVESLLAKHNIPVEQQHIPNVARVNYKALIKEIETGELRSINNDSLIQTIKTVRPCGHSTIRLDLTPPRIKGVMEFRNFGNEGGVGTVVNPSPATVRGLDDHELGVGRGRAQIETIFKNAGLEKSHNFEEVWARAQGPDGNVSFASFQSTLDRMI